MPLELPAVTVPPARNAGCSVASFSAVVPGRGCSSAVSSPAGTSSSANRPASCAAAQRACDSRRERVLILTRDAPALGDVLAGLPHRLARVPLLVARIDEAPAEGRVVQRPVAAGERHVRLRRHERRPGHRLDAARDEEIAVPGDDGMAGTDDRREARRAQAVDGDAGDGVGEAGEQRGEARDVPVVLARLVRAAEPDVLDLSAGTPARATASAITTAARSSGRTAASPPP